MGPLLLQQQAHPIMFAELLYRHSLTAKDILTKYSAVVESTAEFMAAFALSARGHSTRGCLNLGPPSNTTPSLEVNGAGCAGGMGFCVLDRADAPPHLNPIMNHICEAMA